MSTFQQIVRDLTKLYSVWPGMDETTAIRFAKEVHSSDLTVPELATVREAAGVTNPRFRTLGRKITEWVVCMQLGTVGYNGRTKEKLVAAALEGLRSTVGGLTSPLLVHEWVSDIYEELAPFANRPMQFRVLAAEKANELKELLKCQSLPKISLRA